MRAMVIRTAGNTDIANAITDGMVRADEARRMEVVMAKLARMKQREARMAVRRPREADYWRTKIEAAEFLYGGEKPAHRAAQAVWGAIGLICYTVDAIYKRLSAWNREAA